LASQTSHLRKEIADFRRQAGWTEKTPACFSFHFIRDSTLLDVMSIICSTSGQQRKLIMFSFRLPSQLPARNNKKLEGTNTEKTCFYAKVIYDIVKEDLSHEKTGAFCQFAVRLFDLEFSQQNKDSFISQDFKFNFLLEIPAKQNGIRGR